MPIVDNILERDAGVAAYLAEYERFDAARAGGEPAWLRATRERAIERFVALGFPTTRDEEWRFTNVSPIAEGAFQLAPHRGEDVGREDLLAARFVFDAAAEIVFVNGRFAPHLSTLDRVPRGLTIRSLREVVALEPGRLERHLARHASCDDQAFTALNTAFLDDGAVVEVAPSIVVTDPVHIVFLTAPDPDFAPTLACPRILAVMERNSQLRLVESYGTINEGAAGRHFTNAVTEVVLGEGAVVDHYRVQRESPAHYHVSTTQLHAGPSSSVSSHSFTLGGGIVRNDVNARLAGEGADCTLNGLYLANGSRLVDNHTFIDHAEPHCGSHELYKGILGGRARAVFNGKIMVRPGAQKTDAKQTNKTLLLSDDAQINTKPQLEIYANDVKCTHGATVGQLSADALFYLQARGIGRDEARRMLVRAFVNDIVARVRIDALREGLEAVLDREGR